MKIGNLGLLFTKYSFSQVFLFLCIIQGFILRNFKISLFTKILKAGNIFQSRSRTAATSKMEHYVITVNGWKLLNIITISYILDVAAVLDPPLNLNFLAN